STDTNPCEKTSNLYVIATCLFRLSELNCVSTKICRRFAFRQLLIGMSINRYLPPIGTAGFDRLNVSGNRRVPRPPPRMIANTSSIAIGGDLYQKAPVFGPGASSLRNWPTPHRRHPIDASQVRGGATGGVPTGDIGPSTHPSNQAADDRPSRPRTSRRSFLQV